MRLALARPRRVRPRTAAVALLTVGLVAVVVLPEAVSASGLTQVHRAPTVPAGLDARRAVVLRPHRVDLVDGGAVLASVPFDGTHATLASLVAVVGDPRYLARARGTVTLQAALVQRPGTSLTIGPDGVHTLHVLSKAGATAYLWGTGAALTMTGVQVHGDAGTPRAVRGYVQYGGGSRVTIRDSAFLRLGRDGRHPIAALDLGGGTVATVSGTTFDGDAAGIAGHRSAAVTVRRVKVTGSATDGITLHDAGTVTAGYVTAAGNLRNGIVLAGAGTRVRSLSDITASRNGHAGLMVTLGAAPVVTRLRTDHNGNAGAVLHGAGQVGLVDARSTAEPTGVRVQDGRPATVTNLTTVDDPTGISADGHGTNLVVRGGSITGAKVGLRVQTPGAVVDGLTVQAADIALESGPAARGLTVTRLTATAPTQGTGTGLIVGGAAAKLTDVDVTGHRTGVRVEGSDATLTGATARATGTGLLLAGSATGARVTGLDAVGGEEGVRISAGADGARIVDAHAGGGTGLRIGAGDVAVSDGTIEGLTSAVVVDTTAGDVSLSGTRVHGTLAGIRMAAASGRLTLDGVQVTGARRNALALDAGSTVVRASVLQAGGTVVDAAAELLVDSTTVTGPVGVHVAQGVTGTLVDSRVDGQDVGVVAVPGSRVTLTASRIYGAVPVRGSATLRDHAYVAAMPLNWLGIAGIGLVVIAVLLMLTARVRERGQELVSLAPAHVANRA